MKILLLKTWRGGHTVGKDNSACRIALGIILLSAGCGFATARLLAAKHSKTKVLGLDRVIVFSYFPVKGFDPKQLHSVTLIGPVGPGDWKYWQSRGVVAGVGHTWYDLLRSPINKAVDLLTGQDFGGNPRPVAMIDEFGFDFGGQMDEKSAQVLRQAKLKKPGLALAVFSMRGPVPQVLAEAYRDVADLVMMECYLNRPHQYWFMATQIWAARRYGLLPKTIVVLGVGKGGNPGENWAESKEELERQIRFVRLMAPESPGVGFYGGTPELLAEADALASQFFRIPTKGDGLPAEVRELARTFTRRYEKPTLAVSPVLVQPNYKNDGSGALANPTTMRAYIINLGDQDAHAVKVRLRNPPNQGDNLFAEGVAPLVPKKDAAVAVLNVTAQWRVWVGSWILEVEAPGCKVISFQP